MKRGNKVIVLTTLTVCAFIGIIIGILLTKVTVITHAVAGKALSVGESVSVDLADDDIIEFTQGSSFRNEARIIEDGGYVIYKAQLNSGTQDAYIRIKQSGNIWISLYDLSAFDEKNVNDLKGEGWIPVLSAEIFLGVQKDDFFYFDISDFLFGNIAYIGFLGSGSIDSFEIFAQNSDLLSIQGYAMTSSDISQEALTVDPLDDDVLYSQYNSQFSGGTNSRHRFADNYAYFTYKVVLPDTFNALWLKTYLKGKNAMVSVASEYYGRYHIIGVGDDENDNIGSDFVAEKYSYFDLKPYVTDDQKEIFIRFSANDKNEGYGAALYEMQMLFYKPNEYYMDNISLETTAMAKVPISADMLFEQGEGKIKRDENERFYVGTTGQEQFVSKIVVPENTDKLFACLELGNANAHIEASADNENFVTIGSPTVDVQCGAAYINGDYYYYDLSEVLKGQTYVYLKCSAASPGLTQGFVLYSLSLYRGVVSVSGDYIKNSTVITDRLTLTNEQEKSTEKDYIVGSSIDSQGYRVLSAEHKGVYAFKAEKNFAAVYLSAQLKGQWALSISTDLENWSLLGVNVIGNETQIIQADVTKYCGSAECVYIQIKPLSELQGMQCAYKTIALNSIVNSDAEADKNLHFSEGALTLETDLYNSALVYADYGSQNKYDGRYVSEGASFVYSYMIPENANALYFMAEIFGNIKFYVSENGNRFSALPEALISDTGEGYFTLSLAPYLQNEKIYLMFVGGENGGCVRKLCAVYNPESDAWGELYRSMEFNAFISGTAQEKEFLYTEKNSAFIYEAYGNTHFGTETERVYKFDLSEEYTNYVLYVSAGGAFTVSVSTDGVTYKDIFAGAALTTLSDMYYSFDGTGCQTVYVRFASISEGSEGILGGIGITGYSGKALSFDPGEGLPTWGVVLIVVGAALLTAAAVCGVVVLKRKKKSGGGKNA